MTAPALTPLSATQLDELEARLKDATTLGQWVFEMLSVTPALLAAARQNERRGELLRRIRNKSAYLKLPPTLRKDIAKELENG